METALEWSAAIGAMLAAGLIAAELGRKITGYAFVLFSIVSVIWIVAGFMTDTMALVAQNGVLLLINLWGVYQHLFREERKRGKRQQAQAPA